MHHNDPTNLTINELVCIDAYAENGMKGYKIAQKIERSPQNNGVSREVLGAGEHDRCFKGFLNTTSKPCNRAFIKRLLPIVQLNKGKLTYRANYVRATMILFSKIVRFKN